MIPKRTYLFILSPPFEGSTVLYRIINTSPAVSTFWDYDTWSGEGQWLLPSATKDRWNDERAFDFENLKLTYDRYWDHAKPIHVDKSPPMICRAKALEDYFQQYGDVYFLLLTRNPYATRKPAIRWVRHATYQKTNLYSLTNVLHIRFEDVLLQPDKTKQQILQWLPDLEDLSFQPPPIRKQNTPLQRLSTVDTSLATRFLDVDEKNAVLRENQLLLKTFGYAVQ